MSLRKPMTSSLVQLSLLVISIMVSGRGFQSLCVRRGRKLGIAMPAGGKAHSLSGWSSNRRWGFVTLHKRICPEIFTELTKPCSPRLNLKGFDFMGLAPIYSRQFRFRLSRIKLAKRWLLCVFNPIDFHTVSVDFILAMWSARISDSNTYFS